MVYYIENEKETINFTIEKDNIIILQDNECILNIMLNEYFSKELNINEKNPPTKRISILIISKNKFFVNAMTEKMLLTNSVIEHSNRYRKFLQDKNIFCNMNSKEYTPVYWGHYLNVYYENELPENIPMLHIYPLALGRENFKEKSRGDRNALGKLDNVLPPAFVISDVLSTAYNFSNNFDYVFIDATSIKKPFEIINFKCPSTIFFSSYFDERLPYILNSNQEFWGLVELDNLENLVIKYINTNFDNELEEAFKLLKDLKKEAMPNFELKIGNKILYNIIRTCIEGLEYDFIAKAVTQSDMIRDLIKELKDSDYKYVNRKLEKLIVLIEDIYNKYKLDEVCPKYEEILRICERAYYDRKKILIVVSSKIDSIGLKEKLSLYFDLDIDSLVDYGFNVATYYDVLKMKYQEYDEVIITSAIRFKDLDILTKNLGKKTLVLLYQIEIRELKTKYYALSEIKNCFDNGIRKGNDILVYDLLYRKLKNADTGGKKLFSELEIENLISSLDKIKVDYSVRVDKPYKGENSVRANLITFQDGSKIFLKPGMVVQYINNNDKNIVKKYARDLKRNDVVVFIDGDIREDLYRYFLESVNSGSESSYHYEVVKKWKYTYEDKFIYSKIDVNRLNDKMKKLGWNKLTKFVLNNWKNGYSFGPRDKEDIEYLGKALNIKEFINDAEFYHSSMRYIRTERRLASRILNQLIFYSNKKIVDEDFEILEKYNVTLEDLQKVVSTKKVKDISNRLFSIKSTETGIIFERED
ncbi:DISARM system-associated protein DrmE [Lysinibacillus sp. FSL L8-0126]|uniref:DISARM system-associated protein DrmE n=1 Tax=Lysinibacillus sp. FSL L8-0126 TaxID=2921515 RepID=UPI00315AA6B8